MRMLVLVLVLFAGCAACEAPVPAALPPEECSSSATVGGYEMGNLPVSRTVTLAPGDAVPSNLLNEIEDAFVALNTLLTGGAQALWSPNMTLAGNVIVNGATTLNGKLNGPIISNVITPVILAGNNNDFAPTGFANVISILFSGSGSSVITGMAGGVHGRMVYLINVGLVTTTITHNDSNSSANNRFLTPAAATITLTTDQGTMWMYDTTGGLNRWRLMSKNF